MVRGGEKLFQMSCMSAESIVFGVTKMNSSPSSLSDVFLLHYYPSLFDEEMNKKMLNMKKNTKMSI